MARRKMLDPCIIPVNMRITEEMKKEVDFWADSMKTTSNGFIRMAIQEKIDRMKLAQEEIALSKSARADAAAAEMEERVRRIVMRVLDDSGIIYKKDSAAAAEEEQRPAGSTELRDKS